MHLELRVNMLKQGAAVGEKIMEAAERDEQKGATREARENEVRIANERDSMFEAEPQPGDLGHNTCCG